MTEISEMRRALTLAAVRGDRIDGALPGPRSSPRQRLTSAKPRF